MKNNQNQIRFPMTQAEAIRALGPYLWEYEKKEIHEWTAMCERYDGGGKGEAGGLTLTEMRQMVAENNACAEGEEGMARLEKQVGTAAADVLAGLQCAI